MLFFKRNPNNNLQKEILTSRNSIISYIQDFLYKCFCPPCKKNAESVFCNLLGTLNLCLFKQTLPCMSSVAYTGICPGGRVNQDFPEGFSPKERLIPLGNLSKLFFRGGGFAHLSRPRIRPWISSTFTRIHGIPCTREYQSNTQPSLKKL